MCQKAPFKALKQAAVQAANDINRMTHMMLVYVVSCLEQVGKEEGCTHSAGLAIAPCWVSLSTSDSFHRSQLSQHLD